MPGQAVTSAFSVCPLHRQTASADIVFLDVILLAHRPHVNISKQAVPHSVAAGIPPILLAR
jgi:hypothetical protein